jgi:hypothetical protein
VSDLFPKLKYLSGIDRMMSSQMKNQSTLAESKHRIFIDASKNCRFAGLAVLGHNGASLKETK